MGLFYGLDGLWCINGLNGLGFFNGCDGWMGAFQ